MISLDSPNLNTDGQQTTLRSLVTKEVEFWRDKQSELDSDIEVQQLRNAAGRIECIPFRTNVLRTADGPILTGEDLPGGQIALTFDDGPHPVATKRIQHTLTENGLCCNFFQVGYRAQKYPTISSCLTCQGHVVASHSMSHKNLTQIPEHEAQTDIIDGHYAVTEAAGYDSRFFRFPFGQKTANLQGFVQKSRLATFFYNIDSLDWDFQKQYKSDLRLLLRGVISLIDQAGSGILLLHDTWQTALVLPDLIDYLKVRQFIVVQFVSGD